MADRMNKESVTAWVAGLLTADGDMCIQPPFTQKSIYWNGSVMSLSRVVCGEKNGWPDDLRLLPVRTCGTPRCANGRHYRWGTSSEAAARQAVPRDHRGDKNPNAKLNLEKAREIRAKVGRAPAVVVPEGLEVFRPPRSTALSYHQAMSRRECAVEYGVSLKTIDKVMTQKIWPEPKEGDEF